MTKPTTPRSGKRVKRRTTYLVIIRDGKFGFGNGRTWVFAWDNKDDARKDARQWAKNGFAHDVVEFREVPAPQASSKKRDPK